VNRHEPVVQAFLFGIGLKFAGFANAGLLGFVMMILSMVQLGAAIVLNSCIVCIWMTKDVAFVEMHSSPQVNAKLMVGVVLIVAT
jgi:hypothetical protein